MFDAHVKEMLECAAIATGVKGKFNSILEVINLDVGFGGERRWWNPLDNSGDCAAMCAKLMIDAIWWSTQVECISPTGLSQNKEYNNDRESAWRYAATMVAAKIGGMK
jgi:hypothetical protein